METPDKSEKPEPAELDEGSRFFREILHRQMGWGFALIFVEAGLILNDSVHFDILGEGKFGVKLPEQEAEFVMHRTKALVGFMTVFTLGWMVRTIEVRCKLPKHRTVPSWAVVFVGIAFILGCQLYIIRRVSGIPLWALPGVFFPEMFPSIPPH